MKKKYLLGILLLIVGSLFMVISCTQETSRETETSVFSEDYKLYSHDGLSLQYPSHWTLVFDETNALYSDRAAAFDAPETSRLTIYIFDTPGKTSTDIADIFIRTLKLKTKEHVKNFTQTSIAIGKYTGLKLTWKDTLIIPFSIELTVIQVNDSPTPLFAVFNMTDEKTINFIPVLNSIKFKQ